MIKDLLICTRVFLPLLSVHLHQQAGKHWPQPGPQEDPAAPGSLRTRPALSGAPAGRPGLHRQRLPAENSLHPADARLRRRKDIRCCTETSLRCCFLLCNSICARVRLLGFKVGPPVWIFQPRSMGSSTFSACLWWTASTTCSASWRNFVAACTARTSSATSPLPSTAVAPTSRMVPSVVSHV